ncbi:MAG TPA: hypothetical protein VGL76_02285, partial [Gaiellaceae bacterium]
RAACDATAVRAATAWPRPIGIAAPRLPIDRVHGLTPGAEGEQAHTMNWQPWKPDPDRPRPRRGGPHGRRSTARAARRRERAGA